MNADTLSPFAIESQGQSPLFLIGGIMAAVFLGAILGAVGRSMGIPEKVTYLFPLVLGLAAAGFAIWYSVAPQGWIRLDPEVLVVEPRMRAPVTWRRGSSDPSLRAWQLRASGITRVAGPLMDFRLGDGSFTIGAQAPELARDLPPPEGITLLVMPDYLVSGDDFVRLAKALGFNVPGGENP